MRIGLAVVLLAGAGCRQIFGLEPPVVRGDAGVDIPTGDSQDASASARKKAITISGAKVSTALADFPVWISFTAFDIAARASTDGSDIFFTDASGVALAYELQTWRAGVLEAWVRVPNLPANADTTIYVRYGDRAAAVPPDAAAVFSSSYAGVWHLDDDPGASTITDSTGHAPGMASGFTNTSRAPGELGFGRIFDGTGSEQITFTNPLVGNGPHTISAWVDQGSSAHSSPIVVVGSPATDQARFLDAVGPSTTGVSTGLYADDFNGTDDIQNLGWTYIAWTYSNKSSKLYVNGALISSTNTASAATTTGTSGALGYASSAYGTSPFMTGALDEVRIATVARAPGWIQVEYANQSDPATFYSVGPEQPAP